MKMMGFPIYFYIDKKTLWWVDTIVPSSSSPELYPRACRVQQVLWAESVEIEHEDLISQAEPFGARVVIEEEKLGVHPACSSVVL